MMRKCASKSGLAVIHWVLIAAIVILLVLISIPTYKYYTNRAAAYGCASELATAKSMLTIEYLANNTKQSAEDTKDIVAYYMDGWESLCPSGGTTYVIDNPAGEPPYTVVCGLHDKDANERTRLNASRCLYLLRDAVKTFVRRGKAIPDTIDIEINGMTLPAKKVNTLPVFKRGTSTTKDYETEDYVLFFTVNSDGNVSGLVYADKNHCANYDINEKWTGDSYDALSTGGGN